MKWLSVLLLTGSMLGQTVDKKFLIVNGLSVGAAALDAHTTNVCLARPGFQETNPLVGTHPSPIHVDLWAYGFAAGSVTISYFLKRHHSKLWLLLPAANIGGHGVAGGLNASKGCL